MKCSPGWEQGQRPLVAPWHAKVCRESKPTSRPQASPHTEATTNRTKRFLGGCAGPVLGLYLLTWGQGLGWGPSKPTLSPPLSRRQWCTDSCVGTRAPGRVRVQPKWGLVCSLSLTRIKRLTCGPQPSRELHGGVGGRPGPPG